MKIYAIGSYRTSQQTQKIDDSIADDIHLPGNCIDSENMLPVC